MLWTFIENWASSRVRELMTLILSIGINSRRRFFIKTIGAESITTSLIEKSCPDPDGRTFRDVTLTIRKGESRDFGPTAVVTPGSPESADRWGQTLERRV